MSSRDTSSSSQWDTPEWRRKNIEINRLLPTLFPELAGEYQRRVVAAGDEDEGPMVVYRTVFHDFLAGALRSEPADHPLVERLLLFLDLLANHPDAHVSETATVEIAEFLGDEPDLCEMSYSRLGARMRSALETATN